MPTRALVHCPTARERAPTLVRPAAQLGSPGCSAGGGSEESQQTAAALVLAAPAQAARPPALLLHAGPLSGTPQSVDRRAALPWPPAPGDAVAPDSGDALVEGVPAGPARQGSLPTDTLQALLEEMEGLPSLEGTLAGPACLDW